MNRQMEAVGHIETLRHFMSRSQIAAIGDGCRGEEKDFFFAKLAEMASVVESMPKVYETDGQGDEAIVHLHYFRGGSDYHIIEKDTTDEQIQAFGLCDLGMGYPELGYAPIREMIELGFELDLHWTPKPLKECRS